MTGSAALYQAAIVLIPVLLFGGALREVWEDQHDGSSSPRNGKLLGLALFLSLFAGLTGMLIALRGAIEPASVHEPGQRILVAILTLGTAGVAVLAAAPLLKKRTGVVRLEPLRIIGFVALAVVVGQFGIGASLEQASKHEDFESASRRSVEVSRSMQVAEERNLIAREHLLGVVEHSSRPLRAAAGAEDLIAQLEGARSEIEEGFTADDTIAQLDRGFAVLSRVDRRIAEESIRRPLGMSGVDADLYLLAEQRLTAAMAVVMSTLANQVLVQRDLRGICGDANASWDDCG